MTTRRFLLGFLLVSVLVAGVASYYASSHPDGLEHVAATVGFSETAADSPTANGPLADYSVSGIEDSRLSGGLAGVIGVGVVLMVSTGLFAVLRRRRPDPVAAEEPTS